MKGCRGEVEGGERQGLQERGTGMGLTPWNVQGPRPCSKEATIKPWISRPSPITAKGPEEPEHQTRDVLLSTGTSVNRSKMTKGLMISIFTRCQ